MKMTAFWDIAPCIIFEVDDFSGVFTASIINETTRRNIQETCNLNPDTYLRLTNFGFMYWPNTIQL
jgi:hypothetical protein